MAPTIQTSEPADFTAGDSVYWNLTDATYPPSEGWALTYSFLGPTTFQLGTAEISVDAASDSYQIRVPTTKTSPLSPGTYTWYRTFTKASTGERYGEVARGATVIRLNPAAAGSTLTEAEKQLVNYKAARDAILSGGVKQYTVADRSFTKLDLPYINKQIGIYSDKVRRERAAANDGGPVFGRTVGVRFRLPGER